MKRRLVTRSTLTGLVALAALAVAAVPSQATASSPYLLTSSTKSIDGYKLGSNYTVASGLFGGPISSTQDRTTCTAQWANGVTLSWQRTLPSVKWQKSCTKFSWARVAGKSWHTDRGLRIGSPESQITKIYHGATSTKTKGYSVWSLQKASTGALQAWTKNGRVVFLALARG